MEWYVMALNNSKRFLHNSYQQKNFFACDTKNYIETFFVLSTRPKFEPYTRIDRL